MVHDTHPCASSSPASVGRQHAMLQRHHRSAHHVTVETVLDDQRPGGAQQRPHDRVGVLLAGDQDDGRPHQPPYW